MRQKSVLTAILATVLTAGSVGADGEATITEFPTPSASSLPEGMDIGQDGDIWYAETSVGKVALLRSNHTTSEFRVPNGGQPIIIKVASDGIWFTDGPGHAIGHLNPATGSIVEYAIPSGSAPLFLQIGPDGSKWFSKTTGVGRLARNGAITEWDVTLEHPDDNIEQISLDPSGDLWFVERNFDGAGAAGTNKVRRLNPATNLISTYLVPTVGGNPAGVLANPNGTVWVAEYFDVVLHPARREGRVDDMDAGVHLGSDTIPAIAIASHRGSRIAADSGRVGLKMSQRSSPVVTDADEGSQQRTGGCLPALVSEIPAASSCD